VLTCVLPEQNVPIQQLCWLPWVAQVSFARDSWTAPVDAARLRPADDTDQHAARRIHALLGRLPAIGIPIADQEDQESEASFPAAELHQQVPSLLVTHSPTGCGRSARWIVPGWLRGISSCASTGRIAPEQWPRPGKLRAARTNPRIVNFYLYLATAFVVVRRLIQQTRTAAGGGRLSYRQRSKASSDYQFGVSSFSIVT
jgi:hypothetical protein